MTAREKIEHLALSVIKNEKLDKKNRQRPLVYRRCYISHILKDKLGWTYSDVGRAFNKHHATILHLHRNHKYMYSGRFKDEVYIDSISDLVQLFDDSNFFDDRMTDRNIFLDILASNSFGHVKLIQKKILDGYYNIDEKAKFVSDRATDTGKTDQEVRE